MAHRDRGPTRRQFIGGMAVAGVTGWAGGLTSADGAAEGGPSKVFAVTGCPPHDGRLRHLGVDAMLGVIAQAGLPFYRTNQAHRWGGPSGVIDRGDVVVVKVNCQWKCRGTTNTDVVRGLVHRILGHPDGFVGQVVLMENGQGRGSFSGINPGESSNYGNWPEVLGEVVVNSEDGTLTIDRLVDEVFAGWPVSSFLLDGVRGTFLAADDHTRDGYRRVSPPPGSWPPTAVSYPCFTTALGARVELREGIWNGREHADNLKLINVPVLKHHGGSGMTGALKHMYGVLSMSDGNGGGRHYSEIGSQVGKMWKIVRSPDLNLLDCIWVSHASLTGYPADTTRRCDTLLGGLDPVALDWVAAKHVLLPLGGRHADEHDPDTFDGLARMLAGARDFINANGGIGGRPAQLGEEAVDVITRRVSTPRRSRRRVVPG